VTASDHAIVTTAQMSAIDAHAAERGVATLTLMENAGHAVADEILKRFSRRPVAVLCGPGNNGGDGYVVARILRGEGWPVELHQYGDRAALKGDAASVAKRWSAGVSGMDNVFAKKPELIVDALFGAGLARKLDDQIASIIARVNEAAIPVVAIDVPSGVHGDTGKPIDGISFRAALTVTFFRKKLAHVIYPGRALCGEIVVAQIGIPPDAMERLWPGREPALSENTPPRLAAPAPDAHKYQRGYAMVVSGAPAATGAARLAAAAALRSGAGLVSVASPRESVAINAAHLTAVMVKPFDGVSGFMRLIEDKRINAIVIGPGLGATPLTREMVAATLASKAAAVLDADALTSFAGDAAGLKSMLRPDCVLTPHVGEFERLFPGLLESAPDRASAALEAARRMGCVIVLKGADSVIARPDGHARINTNAPPWLATAGAGDVLAGIIGGLAAQGMKVADAAAAGVFIHGEAAKASGWGMTADDLPALIPPVLRKVMG